MATSNVHSHALQTPDAIKELRTFNGNNKHLFEFISNVEDILTCIPDINRIPCGTLWLRAIRNKIVGPADETLQSYGILPDWKDIKEILILHYGDCRDEEYLFDELYKLKQLPNTTVEQYYLKIIELHSALTRLVRKIESCENIIKAKIDINEKIALKVFLDGLQEPLDSIVRCKGPSNLKEAYYLCRKEQNTLNTPINENKNKKQNSHLTQQVTMNPPLNVQQPPTSFTTRPPLNVEQPSTETSCNLKAQSKNKHVDIDSNNVIIQEITLNPPLNVQQPPVSITPNPPLNTQQPSTKSSFNFKAQYKNQPMDIGNSNVSHRTNIINLFSTVSMQPTSQG